MADLTIQIDEFLEVVRILSAPIEEYTLTSLSREMKLSISDLRRIIDTGLRKQDIYSIKLDGIDWIIASEHSAAEESSNNKEISLLSCGFYDNSILSLSSKNGTILTYEEIYNLLCDEIEKSNEISPESKLNDSIFVFKSNYSQKTIYLTDKYNPLIGLVDYNLQNRIKTPCLLPSGKTIYPLGIYYSNSGNSYAIARSPEDDEKISCFPFSKLTIKDNIDNQQELREYEYNHIKKMKKQLWAPQEEVDWKKDPIEYRILVMNEPNTKAKVLRDLARIDIKEKAENEDGILYLSFSLYDSPESPEFFQWILSYGSSIVVLSPSWCREKVLREYLDIIYMHMNN